VQVGGVEQTDLPKKQRGKSNFTYKETSEDDNIRCGFYYMKEQRVYAHGL
jgi:hypothetical protein